MKKIIHKIGTLFILTALFTACSTATITAAHVTQPVMLGKVKKIHGQESGKGEQKMPFDIRVRSVSDPFLRLSADSLEADAELLKRIDSPDDEVIVDDIWVASRSLLAYPGVPYGDFCEVAILGGLYGSEQGGHENK